MEISANTKKLPRVEQSILKIGLIGYILRIIPLVEIVGFILTGILWYNIYKVWKKSYFLIVSIMLFVAIISLIGSSAYSMMVVESELSVPTNTNISTDPIMILNTTYDQMMSSLTISNLVNNGIQIIVVLLEAVGFLLLYREFSYIFKPYVFILLMMLGLAMIFSVVAIYISLANLKSLIIETERLIESGETIDPATIGMNIIAALMPMIIAGLLAFILRIIAYVVCAITINRYKKAITEEKVLGEPLPPPPTF